jgi:hypothetical protein
MRATLLVQLDLAGTNLMYPVCNWNQNRVGSVRSFNFANSITGVSSNPDVKSTNLFQAMSKAAYGIDRIYIF